MFSHGDTASDPAEISTASSNTEFLAALPKHYLTCTFPRLGVGFVCLDKVSRTMFRQEKGLIFAILVFTIPFESSIDVSFFPKGGEGRDPPKGRLQGRGRRLVPREVLAMVWAPVCLCSCSPPSGTAFQPCPKCRHWVRDTEHPFSAAVASPCCTRALASDDGLVFTQTEG